MKRKLLVVVVALAVSFSLTAVAMADPGNGIPANKTAVAASKAFKFAATNDNPDLNVVTLLSETVRSEEGGSYLIQFTTECFIGSYDIDSSIPYSPLSALDGRLATVAVWVEIDGTPQPHSKVNFCSHGLFQLTIDPTEYFDLQLEKFGGAYGFNWPVLGLSHGIHTIKVRALLLAAVLKIDEIPDEGTIAVVGKRTLIVEPIHVRVDETYGDDSPPQ